MGNRFDFTIFSGIMILTLILTGVLVYSQGSFPGYDTAIGFGFELDFFIATATTLIARDSVHCLNSLLSQGQESAGPLRFRRFFPVHP